MRQTTLTFAFAIGLFSAASAQDGGKIPWKKDVKPAIEEAKKSGKAAMLFFTSLG